MKRIVVLTLVVLFAGASAYAQQTPPSAYSLDDCIGQALKHSPTVLAAEKEVKRAGGVVWETWSNIISADLVSEYTYRESPLVTTTTTGGEDFSTYFEASVPLFSGGRVINGVTTAYVNRHIAEENYRKAVNGTVYSVRTTFGQILLNRELVRVRKEEVDFLQNTYDAIKGKYDVGMASWFEVLRSQVELTNAQPSLMEAEDSLALATDNLKRLLGIDVGQPLEITGDLTYREFDMSLEDALSQALIHNPDISIAVLSEDVAHKEVRSTIGEYFPTVSLFGRYAYASDTAEIAFNDNEWEGTGGIIVTMPITDLIATSARLKQARANLDKAKINRADTENGIKLETRSAYRDLVRSKKVVESQKENVKLAKESLDIAQIQYDNGINTYLELMDTNLALTQANLNYIDAIYAYLEAVARTQMLTGLDFMTTKTTTDATVQDPPSESVP